MAHIRNYDATRAELRCVDSRCQALAERVDADTALCRDAEGVGCEGSGSWCGVYLIYHADMVLRVAMLDSVECGGICRSEVDDDAGVGDGAVCAVDAHLLERIGSGVDARSIDKAVAHAINHSRSLNGVACGAGDIRHHGPILLDKGVE